MGYNNKFALQTVWDDFVYYMYTVVLPKIPRYHRASLSRKVENTIWEISEAVEIAAYTRENRRTYLVRIDEKAKGLQSMLRLAIKINAVPNKRETEMAKRLLEIGKIVGGLLKKTQASTYQPSLPL